MKKFPPHGSVLPLLLFVFLWTGFHHILLADPPKLMFNSDGGILFKFKPPMTADHACVILDQLKDTQVDVFMPCINGYGDDQMVYPTQVAEVFDNHCLEGHTVGDDKIGQLYRKAAGNMSALIVAGHDPLRLWQQRCRELGKDFCPSLRMNDIHEDDTRFIINRSQWKEKNQHLLIGPDIPEHYPYGTSFSWASDYAREEIRQRRLAIITEVCQNYDVDGFEMDFQRHNFLFKKGQEREGMELLNDFMREVRSSLNEIGKNKQKTILIHARVPETLELCSRVGIDARTWIRENLIDWITPMSPGYLDMDADISAFRDLADGTNCKIAGGLERSVNFYKREGEKNSRTSIEMMRAAAASFWFQGVDSIYLFNFDPHSKKKGVPFTPYEIQILQEIGDPQLIARRNKHYFITCDDGNKTVEQGGVKPLPAELNFNGAVHKFEMTIGDDIASAHRDKAIQSICLRVWLDKLDPAGQNVRVRVNGLAADNATMIQNDSKPQLQIVSIDNPPIGLGKNHISVSVHATETGKFSPVRIEGVDLLIEYHNKNELSGG